MGAGLFHLFALFKVVGEPAPTDFGNGIFGGWGRVYFTCLQLLRLLVNPPLRVFGNGVFGGWGRVYFTCLQLLRLLVNPPLRVFEVCNQIKFKQQLSAICRLVWRFQRRSARCLRECLVIRRVPNSGCVRAGLLCELYQEFDRE